MHQPAMDVFGRLSRYDFARMVLLALGAPVIAGVVLFVVLLLRANALGETCTTSADCRTNQCLPKEPIENDRELWIPPLAAGHDPRGVCTKYCTIHTDCPATMYCGAVISYDSLTRVGMRSAAIADGSFVNFGLAFGVKSEGQTRTCIA